MKIELKDWLNSINFNKQDLTADDPTAISSYPPYIINRWLSGTIDSILFANEMNLNAHVDKDMQYAFFLYTLRKKKTNLCKNNLILTNKIQNSFFCLRWESNLFVLHIYNCPEMVAKCVPKIF